jgi:hypothetical protein
VSDLQIALTVAGALVIACVIVYNRIQESRFRRRADASLGADRGDALLDQTDGGPVERIEPLLKAETVAVEDVPAPVDPRTIRVEPVGVPADSTRLTEGEPSPIDYPVQVVCGQAVAETALRQLLEALGGLGRRTQVAARVTGAWVVPAEGHADVSHLRVALQLADRRGHVTPDELNAFVGLVTQWARNVGASVEAPDPQRYLEAARELDRFCADVDVVVGLNVVAPNGAPFAGSKVLNLAQAAGMRLEDGTFRLADASGSRIFCMESQQGEPLDPDRLAAAPMSGVTLLLDVPRLEHGLKAFDQMIDTGRHLASALGGTLVDDNRTPVTDAGLEQIRRQLRGIYAAMEAKGIHAGSGTALRLFS